MITDSELLGALALVFDGVGDLTAERIRSIAARLEYLEEWYTVGYEDDDDA